MPQRKCPKTDVNSSPSSTKSSEYCMTEESIRNMIPPSIWEKQGEALKRAGFSPPDGMQFRASQPATGVSSECDDLLNYLDNAEFWFDGEAQPCYHDEQLQRVALTQENHDEATSNLQSTTQSPPCMSQLTLGPNLDIDQDEGAIDAIPHQTADDTSQDADDDKTKEAPSSLPKTFFTQEDQMPVDDFSSSGDEEGDDDDDDE